MGELRDSSSLHSGEKVLRKLDVCLVNMPYAQAVQPSVALGLLKAILKREGHEAACVYANLDFLREIGFRRLMWVMKAKAADGLRDWTFAPAAFPFHKTDADEYLRKVMLQNRAYDGYQYEQFRKILLEVRDEAIRFAGRMARRIVQLGPRVVGCTTSLTQHVSSLALLRKVREIDPHIVTVLGGANCEGIMGLTTHRSFPWVDFVVSGDADGLIVPLVRAILEHGREMDGALLPVGVYGPGQGLKQGGTAVGPCHGLPRCAFEDLANLPVPDYDEYFAALKVSPKWMQELVQPSLPLETSRGCWWKDKAGKGCTFCSHSGCGTSYRSKAAARVLSEIDELTKRYGVYSIQSIDNIIDPSYFKTLLPALARRRKPLRLFYEMRPDVSRDEVELMREAGVNWVWAGLESLHSELLNTMNKGFQAWRNVQFLRWCLEQGIYVGWNIIYDFPGEHDGWYAEMAERVPALFHLQPPSGCVRLRFDRDSHYFQHQTRYGLKLGPPELYSYVYPLSRDDLKDQMYFMEDEKRKWRDILYSPLTDRPGLGSLIRAVSDWQKCFNAQRRPSLTMTRRHAAIHISDSRPVATAPEYVLAGPEADVFSLCLKAPRESRMAALAADCGVSGGAWKDILAGMISRKLVLAIDGRYVALPVCEPKASLPDAAEYPGGGVTPRINCNVRQTDDS